MARSGNGTTYGQRFSPFLDVAVYHCQQAAEKAVRGFLVHHGRAIERTHDVEVLVDLARTICPTMDQLADAADALTPYATRFRYPNAAFSAEPDRAEFEEAFKDARAIYDFVLNELPLSSPSELKKIGSYPFLATYISPSSR